MIFRVNVSLGSDEERLLNAIRSAGRRYMTDFPYADAHLLSALVVDSNAAERHLSSHFLREVGCTVSEAGDGRRALEMITLSPPDLLYTEIVLPEKDGLEIVAHVRKRYPGTIIVAVSGSPRAHGYLSAAKLMGAHHILRKPVPREALLEIVAQRSQKRHSR